MPSASPPVSDRRAWATLAIGCACIFVWLVWRNYGLYPAIFADEWYYSKMARLTPLGEAIVPSYLYLWLFSASNACGTGFLDCVRLGNTTMLVAAAPFIYLLARQVTRPGPAVVVTLLSLMAPLNLVTAFFMPEATYFFGFVLLSWIMLTRAGWGWARQGLAGGVVLGMMSLVKVHALFLLPAICLFVALAPWLRGPASGQLRSGVLGALLLAAVTLGVKFGLGYLLAGEPALSVFGSFYGSAADSNTSRALAPLFSAAFINGRGHLMVMALLLPLPMAMLLLWVVSRTLRRAAGAGFNLLCLYALLTLGAAAGMTVAYTASIAGVGPHEVLRLHLRYYSFTFPLLLMIPAAALAAPPEPAAMAARWRIAAAALVGMAIVTALLLLPRYAVSAMDGPEIAAIPLTAWGGWLVAALGLAVLACWAGGARLAAPLFLFVMLPVVVLLGVKNNSAYLAQVVPGWAPDRAGIAARDTIPRAERKDVTVAASDMVAIMRAQFHIDDKDTAMLELAPGAAIRDYQLPVRSKWLLVIGPHALPSSVEQILKTDEYALVRLPGQFHPLASARLSAPPGGVNLISATEGLSMVESWGRWSDAKQVVLHFDRRLPKRLDVVIKAMAYADNTELPFTMRVGDASAEFGLRGSMQEIRLRFETDGAQRSLTIDVPKPIAPAVKSGLPDVRKLGIGIAEIAIGDAAPQMAASAATPADAAGAGR